MIARTWRGIAATDEAADAYAPHVEMTAFPKMRQLPGHLGAYLFKQKQAGKTIVFVLTHWEDMEAIRGFAGDHLQKSVVEPRAREVLETYDDSVEHFEMVVMGGENTH